jgi:hypothetical protein
MIITMIIQHSKNIYFKELNSKCLMDNLVKVTKNFRITIFALVGRLEIRIGWSSYVKC